MTFVYSHVNPPKYVLQASHFDEFDTFLLHLFSCSGYRFMIYSLGFCLPALHMPSVNKAQQK